MKKPFLLMAFAICHVLSAQNILPGGIKSATKDNLKLAGGNYTSYFNVYNHIKGRGDAKQTPAPKGYEPFYISTFARHGSRWLGSASDYETPIATMKEADSKKQLTEKGKTLLQELQKLRSLCPNDKLGALTDIGAAQHRDIARRMCNNFPEIFNHEGEFFAQSSVSKRCVNSMKAEAEIIDSVIGKHITQASGLKGMQDRLAGTYTNKKMDDARNKGYAPHNKERQEMTPYKRFCSQFFLSTSRLEAKKQITFMRSIFALCDNMQSHNFDIDFWKYFTTEEAETLWTISNRHYYRMFGPSPTTLGLCPLRAKSEMEDIIEGADSIVNRKQWHGGNLRFSHDTALMPLICLMELGTCGKAVPESEIATIDEFWRNHEIFPKAGNIQLVFYRPQDGNGDILVKAMLCEREVTLPATAVTGPYYKWKDIRNHWTNSLKRAN